MNTRDENALCAGEIKKIVIKEKGEIFWEEYIRRIEQSQRENFIDGYKYAIKTLEDGLTKKS